MNTNSRFFSFFLGVSVALSKFKLLVSGIQSRQTTRSYSSNLERLAVLFSISVLRITSVYVVELPKTSIDLKSNSILIILVGCPPVVKVLKCIIILLKIEYLSQFKECNQKTRGNSDNQTKMESESLNRL